MCLALSSGDEKAPWKFQYNYKKKLTEDCRMNLGTLYLVLS